MTVADLVIAETATSTWNYHIREVGEEGIRLSGGAALKGLCGTPVGWDTQIPIETWGLKDHIPSTWCRACSLAFHTMKLVEKIRDPNTPPPRGKPSRVRGTEIPPRVRGTPRG